jgi:hypothetical protein
MKFLRQDQNQMPYKIVKFKSGYAVQDINGKRYSKHPLTKRTAALQLIALHIRTKK